jgi:putative hydrolase of HD superfamily
MENLEKELMFIYEIGTLRHVKRTWEQFLAPGFANVAEHTFRVMWLALMIARNEQQGDEAKIIKMSLLHDLPEARCGDVHHISRRYTKRDEHKAIQDMFGNLEKNEDLQQLYEEYEKRESIESKIVKDADNLDVDLEIAEQDAKGNKFRELYEDNRETVAKDYYTETAKKLYKLIVKSNPHQWQKFARSRFNEGDWKQ